MIKEIKSEKLTETEAKILYDNFVISKRIITMQRDNSDRMSFHHVLIKAGWEHVISNADQDEIIYFLDGKAKISWDWKEVEVSAGSCIYVPAGCEYKYNSQEDATMVCVFSPPAE
jgi:mannose-6-phosphate isomerase-like protein (cupin superfamily)